MLTRLPSRIASHWRTGAAIASAALESTIWDVMLQKLIKISEHGSLEFRTEI